MVEIKKFKGLTTIGVADIAGNGISAIFWFFLATLIEPESYGEIFYYIWIASMAGAFVMIGAQNTITVYTSKNIKILLKVTTFCALSIRETQKGNSLII